MSFIRAHGFAAVDDGSLSSSHWDGGAAGEGVTEGRKTPKRRLILGQRSLHVGLEVNRVYASGHV